MNKHFFLVVCCMFPSLLLYPMEDYIVWDEFENESANSEDSPQERLMMGIENNSLNRRCMRGLIAEGADIHKWQDYPLRQAASFGHANIIRLLLGEGANIHVCQGDVLKRAVASKKVAAVTAILDWSKKENIGLFPAPLVYILLNDVWNQEETEVYDPIALQLEEYYRFLQHNVSDINSLLIRALSTQDTGRVQTLLECHANVLVCDGLALTIAVTTKNVAVLELLLEYAEQSPSELFPLRVVIECIHILTTDTDVDEEIFGSLRGYISRHWTKQQLNPDIELHAAVLKSDPIVARRWLHLGANIHYFNDCMMNFACDCHYTKIVELLLQWSISHDQFYEICYIRTLRMRAGISREIAKLLKVYENELNIMSRPER